MCGIIGVASKNRINNYSWVKKGSDKLIHRGPDDHGEWASENKKVIFAHRRLSIIDLSSLGRQPMNFNNQYYIVLNGEIYNYKELRKILQIVQKA